MNKNRHILLEWFVSKERYFAIGVGCLLLIRLVSYGLLLTYLSHNEKLLFDSLANYELNNLYHYGFWIIVIIAGLLLDGFTANWLQNYYVLRWRLFLTNRAVNLLLKNNSVLSKQHAISNVDQRISQDIDAVTSMLVGWGYFFLEAVVKITVAVYILFFQDWGSIVLTIKGSNYSLYWLFWLLIGFVIVVDYGLSFWFIRQLKTINYHNEEQEANLRTQLIGLVQQGASIKFARLESFWLTILNGHIHSLYQNILLKNKVQFKVHLLQLFNQYDRWWYLILLSPLFVLKLLSLGSLMQIIDQLMNLSKSIRMSFLILQLSYFLSAYRRFMDLFSVLKLPNQETAIVNQNNEFVLKPIVIQLGIKTIHFQQSIIIQKGDWLCFRGPSGAGKTTLLHYLFGNIPESAIVQKEGSWEIPYSYSVSNSLFLPQQIIKIEGYLADFVTHCPQQDYSLFEALGFAYLLNYKGKLESLNLSLGQLQKLHLLRVILLKPEWLFMDEPFVYLDSESVQVLLVILKQHLKDSTVVVVSHTSLAFFKEIPLFDNKI